MSATSSSVSYPGTARADFMTTLDAGHIYEDLAEFIINKNRKYSKVVRPGGKFSDYDIKFTRTSETGSLILNTVEAKLDGRAIDTRNMCVEFETRHTPNSGINATKALNWFHGLHNYDPRNDIIEYIYIPTSKLRKYIEENKPYDMWGGNKKSSHFYLIPLSEMAEYKRYIHINKLPAELVRRIRSIPKFLVDNSTV